MTEVNTVRTYYEASKEDFHLPTPNEKVYKDECAFCFNTPFSTDGLFVCLKSFVGVCSTHLDVYSKNYHGTIFLHLNYKRIDVVDEEPKDKIARLQIKADVEPEIIKDYSLLVYPNQKFEIDRETLGMDLFRLVQSVIEHYSNTLMDKMKSGCSEWDGTDELKESDEIKNLNQQEGIKKLEPEGGWVCEEPGCGIKQNLWLNLTDGSIKCGRKQYKSPYPGNGHAASHAERTRNALTLRLGTIENGVGEVFQYDFTTVNGDNERFVLDSNLKKHVAHFGLDLDKFQKIEKHYLELELELNQRDTSAIQEQGLDLQVMNGPGYTGLVNFGSTCYMNSVLQSLLIIPDFVDFYDKKFYEHFAQKPILKTYDNFNCQLAKVIHNLNSGEFSQDANASGVCPIQFKRVAAKNHPEFSTGKQQDVEQYVRHLFEHIDKSTQKGSNPVDAVRFKTWHKSQDIDSQRVRYLEQQDYILSLSLPNNVYIEGPTEEPKTIFLEDCITATFGEEILTDYVSPVTGEKAGLKRSFHMGSFPDYLIVQLKRFGYYGGEEVKFNLHLEHVDTLDLTIHRSDGRKPDEELMPDEESDKELKFNPQFIEAIVGMGFSENAAKRGLSNTLSANTPDAAIDWVLTHMNDEDLNDPLPNLKKVSESPEDIEKIKQLTAITNCSVHQAKYGLTQSNGDLNNAIMWLLDNKDSVPQETIEEEQETTDETASGEGSTSIRDGAGKYKLKGIISHIGRSPKSGHYVAHLCKESQWYIFNDEKVHVSQKPPISLAYLYIYERL